MEHELTSMLLEDALESNFDDYSFEDDINEDNDFLNEYLNACESFMDDLEAELMFDSAMEASGTDNSDKLEELASRARAAEAAMKSAKSKAAKEKAMQEYNSIMQELAVEEKNAKDDAKKKKVKKVIKIVGASILAAAAVFGIVKGAKALKNRKNIKTPTGNKPSNDTTLAVVSDKKVEVLQDVVNEPDPTVSELKTAAAPVIAEVISAPSEPSSSAESKTLDLPEHNPRKNAVDTGETYGPPKSDPKQVEADAKATVEIIMKKNPDLTPQDKKDLLSMTKEFILHINGDIPMRLKWKSPEDRIRKRKFVRLITDAMTDGS